MKTGIDHLVAEGIITEVLARLKSGKEADVYAVRYGGNVVAAKVYKDRAHRSFKNDAAYKEGRAVRNSRSQRAMDKKSSFGRASSEDAWKTAEVDALYKLHAAGVRVPTPVMYLEGVLLMELLLDTEGEAAPRLIDIDLTPEQANAAYRDMVTQLVRILCCDLIHGDLSPYNVLWAANGPTIIDFPQIISAAHNSRSEGFFLRDARNILGHFAAVDRSLNARSGDPFEIWRAYVRRDLTPDFVPSKRQAPRPPPPRAALPPRAPGPRNAPHHPAAPHPGGGASPPGPGGGVSPRSPGRGVSSPGPSAPRNPRRNEPHRGDAQRRNAPHGNAPRGDAPRADAQHGQNRRPQTNQSSGPQRGGRRVIAVPEVFVRRRHGEPVAPKKDKGEE